MLDEATKISLQIANLPPSPWTEEKETKLRRLWTDGYTGTQISAAFNGEFSRCAILGKVRRLNLDSRGPNPVPAEEIEARRARKNLYQRIWTKRSGYKPPKRTVPREPIASPDFLALTFDALLPDDCRYPRGEGADLRYCGQPRLAGHSYCKHCYRICYQPERPRRPHYTGELVKPTAGTPPISGVAAGETAP